MWYTNIDMNVKQAIRQLNISEKARILTGSGFWETASCKEIGLPSVKLSDGPNGLRLQKTRPNHIGLGGSVPATCFPTASAAACTFNEELGFGVGARIGAEAAYSGVSMVLGPGLNIKRSPLCGRNFEYFSEDSYLSGKMAAAYVKGIQSRGVSACIKHFAANGREYARMYYDSRVDERTLRETYLIGFEIAVKEGKPGGVMTAYNKLNGEYCNQSDMLINGILRGEWGFDGVVVSDWSGSHDPVKAVKAGADLEMPRCAMSPKEIIDAVECGELDEKTVDKSVERIYAFARSSERIERVEFDKEEHSAFAAKVAEESMVLLKNKGGALPLKRGERVAVIGDFAKKPRYQGAGSSQVVPISLSNLYDELAKTGLDVTGYCKGFKRRGGKSRRLLNSAVRLACKADTVILTLGLDENGEAEGCDRADISINANQIELLKALAALGKKIIVLLFTGSAVATDWDSYADALLLCHLAGQSGAQAAARIISGEVNPSGRLAESYPVKYGDAPCSQIYSSNPLKCDFAEGIYVGYKYYNSFGVGVKYPFGYGLSYTSFLYSGFSVEEGGVRFKVKNTGSRYGATVAQVYIKAPRADLAVSPNELKLFKKIFLKAGEEQEVFIPFDGYSFRVWSEKYSRFTEGGEYEISLAEDSAHMLFTLPHTVAGESDEGEKLGFQEYFNSHISPDEQYIPPEKGAKASPEMTVEELRYCKGVTAKLFSRLARMNRRSKNKMKANVLEWLSVRSLMQFMGLDDVQAEGFLMMCDGHFFKGLKKLFKNKRKY